MNTIQARPTTYNGIQMRSRLEARFAAFLDRAGFAWEYEPRAFASRKGQYLPDFLVRDVGLLTKVYVEVKGAVPTAYWSEMQKMHVILQSEPDANLAFLVAKEADGNTAAWANIAVRGMDHWLTGGGIGICGCGQPRFFGANHSFMTVEEIGKRASDDELAWPISLCECERPGVVAYINPFRLT